MAKNPAAILFDLASNAIDSVLDNSVRRLRVEAAAQKPTTGTTTSVAASASSVTLLAANSARIGATVYNDSSARNLYLLLGTGPATTALFTAILPKNGGYYEVPYGYTGVIVGIWNGTGGFARITELT